MPASPAGALTTEELSHLRRDVKVLRMEREILERAATFFTKESA
jgi:transposase-like protein